MSIPLPLRLLILEYSAEWQLVPWLYFREIDWYYLGANPHPAALELMLAHPDKAIWKLAARHAHAWEYVSQRDDINLEELARNTHPEAVAHYIKHAIGFHTNIFKFSENPSAISWLTDNIHQHRGALSANPAAESLLTVHPEIINWPYLSLNPAPWALKMLEENPDKHNDCMAGNPNGFDILLRRAKKWNVSVAKLCSWESLSRNPDPRAVALALTDPNEIQWGTFSENPGAIHCFMQYKRHVQWDRIFANPAIFELRAPDGLADVLVAIG
jgi:hypothetical protein